MDDIQFVISFCCVLQGCQTIIITSKGDVATTHPDALGAYTIQNNLKNGKFFWKNSRYEFEYEEVSRQESEEYYVWWFSDPSREIWVVSIQQIFLGNYIDKYRIGYK